MATAAANDNTLDNEMACQICFLSFNLENRIPLVGSCFGRHVLCQECSSSWQMQGKKQCPYCRASQITRGKLSEDKGRMNKLRGISENLQVPAATPERGAGSTTGLARSKTETMILLVTSGAGGCGKTTTCSHLAYAMSKLGVNVLVIDADKQGNLSEAMMKDFNTWKLDHCDNDEIPQNGLHHLLAASSNLRPWTPEILSTALKSVVTILPGREGGTTIDLIRGSFKLESTQETMTEAYTRHTRLKQALINIGAIRVTSGSGNQTTLPNILQEGLEAEVGGEPYDVIIIECPYGQDKLFENALFASTSILITARPGGVESMKPILDSIEAMNLGLGLHKKADFGIACIVERSKEHQTQVALFKETIAKQGGHFITTIPKTLTAQVAVSKGEPLTAKRDYPSLIAARKPICVEVPEAPTNKRKRPNVKNEFILAHERVAEEVMAVQQNQL
jgi:cellulose biosynthesis protein BcsQ